MHSSMTSYADNFEDVLLRRAFGDTVGGFYIDVGAHDPVDHSVTKHFYDLGWRGINVEPDPVPFARLVEGRGRDVNLNIGLSDREGQLTLYSAPSATWCADRGVVTGFFGADERDVVERSVPVETLAKVCERHVPEGVTVDFLKIDVEGHEHEVIRGGDWSRWRPRIVLAEAYKVEVWEPALLGVDYHFAFFDGINRFYVREEDRHLIPSLSFPANPNDNFWIHGYLRRINDLEQSLTQYRDLTPMALRFARRLGQASRKHPRASSIVKKIVRGLTG